MTNTLRPGPHGGPNKKIVIIGGGVTGSITAFELSKAGYEVTLIDAHGIGSGSSGKSAACIRQQFGTPSTVRGMKFCTEYYDNWQTITGCKTSPIVHSGYLFLKDWTTNLDELRNTVQMQNDAGLSEVKILEIPEINDLFPYVDTIGVKAATWCPSDGFLYPDMIFNSAAEAARELGAIIITNDEVVKVDFIGELPLAVKTKSGKAIYGDIFINCAGAWAPKVSKLFHGHDLDIKATKRYLYFIDKYRQNTKDVLLTGDYLQKLPMIITPHGCYCRPESKGSERLMTGWLQHTLPVEPTFEGQTVIEKGFGYQEVDSYGFAVRKEIETYIPDVKQMLSLYTATSGFYEETPDHNPLIGYDPLMPNLIHCAGFSGHGLMHGPFSGRAISWLVEADKNIDFIDLPHVGKVDISTFRVDRSFASHESMVI